MKACDRGRGNSVLLIKAAVKVIQFIGKSNVGSGSLLIVGYFLQTLPYVLGGVGGEIVLKLVQYLALPVLMAFPLHTSFSCICRCNCLSTHPISPVPCV